MSDNANGNATRLSYSAVNTYTTCGYKYYLRYKQKYKSKELRSALLFGSAIDGALNVLLQTKDVDKSYGEFENLWNSQYINKKYTSLQKNLDLLYADTDFDHELLHPSDIFTIMAMYNKLDVGTSYLPLYNVMAKDHKDKRLFEWNPAHREFFNFCNWISLYRKGMIMIRDYNLKILPRIKEVITVQKQNYIENTDGDKIVQYIDLVVRWEDNTIILFDNKTAARDYEKNAPSASPQLLGYFHGIKEIYGVQKIGFVVLNKIILKNRIKICSKCEHDGSGERFKTCNNVINGKRCNGDWNMDIKPECKIDVLINDVPPIGEELVMTAFDEANQAIKKEIWYRNLSACHGSYGPCEYLKVCWNNDTSDVVVENGN